MPFEVEDRTSKENKQTHMPNKPKSLKLHSGQSALEFIEQKIMTSKICPCGNCFHEENYTF